MDRMIRKASQPKPPVGGVRWFHVGEGFELAKMKTELDDYTDMLFGRVDPPFDQGVMTLMELAEAAHARAQEMNMHILDGEAEGIITQSSIISKFRKGKLRAFIELTKRTIEVGSRRVTYWQEQNRP